MSWSTSQRAYLGIVNKKSIGPPNPQLAQSGVLHELVVAGLVSIAKIPGSVRGADRGGRWVGSDCPG